MYELTAFYLYKAVFMAELLVAEFLMCIGMKRRPNFILRWVLLCVACIGFAFAIPVISYDAIYCSVVFLLMFAFTLLGLKLCFEESWISVLFRGIAAYTMQHISYQIFDLGMFGISSLMERNASIGGMYGDSGLSDFPVIVYPMLSGSSSASMAMMNELERLFAYCSYLFIYILSYSAGYKFVRQRLKDSDKFQLKSSAFFIFVVCFILFNVIVSSIVTYYSGNNFDVFYVVLLILYNIACSFFTLYLMFEVVYRRQLERGFTIANRLLKKSAEQYESAKQNIELINLKCHDLKHQMRTLRSGEVVSKEAIAELENMISIYDASIHTGNEALDIILTEKSLYCNKHGIKLYCIVDAAKLTFISEADLYSLFGNILDNAIEAVENLEEGKRFINLTVQETNGFLSMSSCNCYLSPLEFYEGLPKSTKSNKELHGYGMKSIRLICKKYNGEMKVSAKDGMFDLNIVFMH